MQIVRGYRQAPAWPGTAIAIGNFDGVHLGHQALVHRARELAAGHGAVPIALTFDPHPSGLLAPAGAPPALTSLARRCELLAAAGARAVVVEPFTRELAAASPEAFVDDLLIAGLHARAIVVGYDFCYGAGRAGTTAALAAHGARAGVAVHVVPPVTAGAAHEAASSSKIRAHLRAGDLAAAEALLGRPYDLDGTVVHGAKRGRAIGIPTANVRPDADLVLATGIYACTLAVEDDAPLHAVASLGTNPTFVDQGGLVLEVHVLDWPQNKPEIYDRHVRVAFAARLRGEAKFDSIASLVEQIHRDIADARVILRS